MKRSRQRQEILKNAELAPQLSALAQQYRLTRRAATMDTLGKVGQSAVMGAAGMAPPDRSRPDSAAIEADLRRQLADLQVANARTGAERMAALGRIGGSRQDFMSELLRAAAQVQASAQAAGGTVAAEKLRGFNDRIASLNEEKLAVSLSPAEEGRLRVAARDAAMNAGNPLEVARIFDEATAQFPQAKMGEAMNVFSGTGGLGQFLPRDGIAAQDLMAQAFLASGGGPNGVGLHRSAFDRAANANEGAAATAARLQQELADAADRLGVPGGGTAIRTLIRETGVQPPGSTVDDPLAQAVLSGGGPPPTPAEQAIMDQLEEFAAGRNAPANMREFRERLKVHPELLAFVDEHGYQNSPIGLKQAFKDVLAISRKGDTESRTQQYGVERAAGPGKNPRESTLRRDRSVRAVLPVGTGTDLLDDGITAAVDATNRYWPSQRAAAVAGATTTAQASNQSLLASAERPVPAVVPVAAPALTVAPPALVTAPSVAKGEGLKGNAPQAVAPAVVDTPAWVNQNTGMPMDSLRANRGNEGRELYDALGQKIDAFTRGVTPLPVRAVPQARLRESDVEPGESDTTSFVDDLDMSRLPPQQRARLAALLRRQSEAR